MKLTDFLKQFKLLLPQYPSFKLVNLQIANRINITVLLNTDQNCV